MSLKNFNTYSFCILLIITTAVLSQFAINSASYYISIKTVIGRIDVFTVISLVGILSYSLLIKRFCLVLTTSVCILSIVIHFASYNYTSEYWDNHIGKKIDVKMHILSIASVEHNTVKYILKSKDHNLKLLISDSRYPIHRVGSVCNLKGKLVAPKVSNDFNYPYYLYTKDIYYQFFPTYIECKEDDNLLFSIFSLKEKVNQIIRESTSEPSASFKMGILWGDNLTFDPNIESVFVLTGTTHIIAASGYNVNFVSFFCEKMFFCLPRKIRDIFISFLLCLYGLWAGISSSILRAIIMSLLSRLCYNLGIPIKTNYILLYTVCIIVLIKPNITIDVSFLLSVFATAGIINLSPIFKKLGEGLSNSLSATLVTSPISILFFKQISLMSVFVNALSLFILDDLMLLTILGVVFVSVPVIKCEFLIILCQKIIISFLFFIHFLSKMFLSLGLGIFKVS